MQTPSRDSIVPDRYPFRPYVKKIGIGFALILGTILFSLLVYKTVFIHNTLQPDYFTFWVAGNAFFLDHESPYSLEVTQRSQIGIYGRPAESSEDQVAFAYPAHSLWLILPTVWMDFPLASSFWLSFNLVLLLAAAYLCCPQAPKSILLSIFLFYPIVYGLLIGNFSLPLGILYLIIYAFLVKREHPSSWVQIGCGVLLSLLTIKPQLMGLVLAAIIAYAVKRHYYRVISGFAIGIMGFVVPTMIFHPGWPAEWLARLVEYSTYQADNQPLAMIYPGHFFSSPLSTWIGYGLILITLMLTVLIAVQWWRNKVSSFLLFSWCGLATLFIDRFQWSSEHIVMIIPLLIWTATRKKDTGRKIIWFACIGFSWLAFFLSLQGWTSGAVDEWPFLVSALWTGIVFLEEKGIRLPGSRRKELQI